MESNQHSSEQRRRMIAEAAYFRAEHRGFQDGDPVQDWLEAEFEIDGIAGRGEEPAWVSVAKQLTNKLRDWDNDFARLSIAVRGIPTTARAELQRKRERLGPLRANAGKALDNARQRGGHALEDLRAISERVCKELADGLESLAKRLR